MRQKPVAYFCRDALVQYQIGDLRGDVQKIEKDLKEVQQTVNRLEVNQAKITVEIQRLNERVSTLEKRQAPRP